MNLPLTERIICAYLVGALSAGVTGFAAGALSQVDPGYLDVMKACMAACLTCVGCVVAVAIAYLLAGLEDES